MPTLTELDSSTSSPLMPLAAANRAIAHWYAAYTCARHEKCVARQLQERDVESFLPLYRSVHRWKDRSKLVELALFPSYVFVRVTPAEHLRVLQVPGIVQLVTFQGRPAPLPEQEMNALRSGLDQQMCAAPHAYLRTGHRVRVIHGPLQGAEGILLQVKGKFRVVITLEALMRAVAVEIDAADVDSLYS